MRWFLACALVAVAGCGEPEEGQGTTFVSITTPSADVFPETLFSCWDDPWGDLEFNTESGAYVWFLNPPAGPCTLLIRLRDQSTGEMICVQEEDFVVSEVGDTEVDITVDCSPTPSEVSGEVFGTSLDANSTLWGTSISYAFVGTRIDREHTALRIADFEETCGPPPEVTPPGKSLFVDFFVDADSDLTVTEQGDFPVWLPRIDGDPDAIPTGPFAVVTFADPQRGRGSVAQTGSATVTFVSESGLGG